MYFCTFSFVHSPSARSVMVVSCFHGLAILTMARYNLKSVFICAFIITQDTEQFNDIS